MQAKDMKNSTPSYALQDPRRVAVYHGIKWIAVDVDIAEKIMSKSYTRRPRSRSHPYPALDYQLAKLMRGRMPFVTGDILRGRAKDLRMINGNALIVSTPPRLYSEWGYDFLKIDICVVGPRDREGEIRRVFREQKIRSLKEKERAAWYVRQVRPLLGTLFDTGLVKGVLGRGSYFGKNCFPRVDDDINFILFARSSDKETEGKIIRVLKRLPKFKVAILHRNEKTLKKGRLPAFSFMIVAEDMSSRIKATNYEKYVLKDGVGIGLAHFPKERSEALARKFTKLLPTPSKSSRTS